MSTRLPIRSHVLHELWFGLYDCCGTPGLGAITFCCDALQTCLGVLLTVFVDYLVHFTNTRWSLSYLSNTRQVDAVCTLHGLCNACH
ncbi:hypothetical protein GDO81_025013 [Engystomops pustulosus]|uniref:Uncharacterized protein n=1 Tax=Engystomops pustulosus TaxID=76066 RepID=A0AAV6YQ96_ENGPU|nr:hypothetical protein GDO81_025013 [Engystomops pustulosus]